MRCRLCVSLERGGIRVHLAEGLPMMAMSPMAFVVNRGVDGVMMARSVRCSRTSAVRTLANRAAAPEWDAVVSVGRTVCAWSVPPRGRPDRVVRGLLPVATIIVNRAQVGIVMDGDRES
jgi:hypothetical protein